MTLSVPNDAVSSTDRCLIEKYAMPQVAALQGSV